MNFAHEPKNVRVGRLLARGRMMTRPIEISCKMGWWELPRFFPSAGPSRSRRPRPNEG